MKKGILILLLWCTASWVSVAQFTPVSATPTQGIAKIVEGEVVLVKSFKVGDVFTIEYLNQQKPYMKQYASFSFEDLNGKAKQFYEALLSGFKQPSPTPLVFNTGKGSIVFEYGFAEPGKVTYVRLAQYDEQNRIAAFSVNLNGEHLKQVFGQ